MKISNFQFPISKQKGFTLIEAIVSTAVFAFVITSITGVLISTLQLNSKSRAQRAVAQNARFIMVFLEKEIRNGKIHYPGWGGTASGTNDLYVKTKTSAIERFYGSNVNCSTATPCDLIFSKGSSSTNLNSSSVKVTGLKFYVSPTTDPFTPSGIGAPTNNEQPRVTVTLELISNYGARDSIKYNLQSTFSELYYPRRVSAAFDSSSGGGAFGVQGLSFSHTVTGSNTLLVVGVIGHPGGHIDTVTFASLPLIKLTETYSAGRQIYYYYLTQAPNGTHDITITADGQTDGIWGVASSFTGIDPNSQPDVWTTNFDNNGGFYNSGGWLRTSLNTTTSGDWTIMFSSAYVGRVVAGPGSTIRNQQPYAEGWLAILDSNGPITPAGITSMSVKNSTGLNPVGTIMAAFRPMPSE